MFYFNESSGGARNIREPGQIFNRKFTTINIFFKSPKEIYKKVA
jgi:hypothetical protein